MIRTFVLSILLILPSLPTALDQQCYLCVLVEPSDEPNADHFLAGNYK